MDTTTLGVFRNQIDAENTINELSRYGIASKDISIVIKDQLKATEISRTTGGSIAGGVTAGITTGGIIGGIAGLLIGIGAVTIPEIGRLMVAGPIALGITGATATTVSGIFAGALAGGLLGALIGLGLPEEEARIYANKIKSGLIILGVPSSLISENDIRNILEKNHGEHVKTINKKPKMAG